ncbi:MAG: hypothetical protein IJA12_02835 [Oscillospiraceae bacterium]|nr:hypothetical protein [Oscillospiraceae bacterium]
MFSKISCEFDSVEFAEYAAKHLRSRSQSPVRISIFHNNRKYKSVLRNSEHNNATHGNVFYLLPTAVTSYNYITARVTRPVNDSLISEPLLNRTVTMIVQTDSDAADNVSGILNSYGGYNVKKS